MNEEKTFVPVSCEVGLRRGTHCARVTFRGEGKEFVKDVNFDQGALVKLYLQHSQVDLSPESENLERANGAMIFFAREYARIYGGLFLRAKICFDNYQRICVILERENKPNFKLDLVTGLILASQVKATLLLDEDLLEVPEEPKAVKGAGGGFDLGLD